MPTGTLATRGPTGPATASDADARPVLAILAHNLPPYRLHFHRRLDEELRGVRLVTILTNRDKERRWEGAGHGALEVIDLSHGDRVVSLYSLSRQLHEWRRGGEVIRALRRLRASAMICGGYDDIGRLRVFLWCWARGVPRFLWLDSNDNDEWGKSLPTRIAKQALLRPIGWLLSGWMACGSLGARYARRFGARPERVYLVPYEPDYALCESVTPAEREAAAARRGLAPGRRRLVYSGRFVPQKRLDLLIDAFARLAPERPQWDLVMLGDGELREELVSRVPASLRDRVIWTGFLDDAAEVGRLCSACDVLVLPSDREPWALVVNEAAAAGLAIVVSEVVGAGAELVRDGVNGRRFHRGSLDDLVAALVEVTAAENIDRYKASSPAVLGEWRERADPVEGVRKALADHGVVAG